MFCGGAYCIYNKKTMAVLGFVLPHAPGTFLQGYLAGMLVLFDFDGTLADTLPRVLRLWPRLARELRLNDPGPEGLQALRSRPLAEVLAALKVPWWKVPPLLWRGRTLLHGDPEPIAFFPGMADLLCSLDSLGVEWGILTTNGLVLVRRALRENGVPEPGLLEAGLGLSGKRERLRHLAQQQEIALSQVVLVADEPRDAEAAQAAGVGFLGVAWGYATAQALRASGGGQIVETPEELLEALMEGRYVLDGAVAEEELRPGFLSRLARRFAWLPDLF